VLGEAEWWGIKPYGGEKPQWFDYPNGARIWMAGLDKSSKVLSSEHDIILVNQAEQLELDEWETLTTRVTGRAGNMPYSQLIGDMNPSYPTHWPYHRPSLTMFYSKHEHNPTLFDPKTGDITERGERTMAVLNRLTGVRRDRLLDGKPARAEGVIVDEYNEAKHRIYEDAVPEIVRWVGDVDWGYTNPGSLKLWGLDKDDRMYLMGQVYHTRRKIDWWVKRAKELEEELGRAEAWLCDPSEPAYIAQFRSAGLNARKGVNDFSPGINAVKQRFDDDRMFFVYNNLKYKDQSLARERKPTCVEEELPAYVWADKKHKEVPVKENDHGVDGLRYAVCYVDKVTGSHLPAQDLVDFI
jgi:phage terminase large subunit